VSFFPFPFSTALIWPLLRLAVVLIFIGLVGLLAVSTLMALALLCPPRMTGGRAMFYLRRLTPQDLGISYEEINFPVQFAGRRLRISSWWMPCDQPSHRCVIILHGYADSKIGGIAWAGLWQSLGFNVLAIDLRAHGTSQGRFSTAGFHGRYDVMQVIDQLKSAYPDQTRRLCLFGDSYGAAIAAATAVLRQDVSAIVMDCPYLDFPSAVVSHAHRLAVPGRQFQRLALRFAQFIAHIDYAQVRPVDLIGKVPCPLWVIQSGDDPFVNPTDQAAIAAAFAARSGPGALWHVADSFHVLAYANHPQEYRQRLADFLAASLESATSPAKVNPV
jgi:hypothetical protein